MFSKQRGQTLVELLVVIGVMAIMLPALATAMVATREGRVQESARLQAASMLNEQEEAIRVVRQAGWQQFAINGTYHPVVTGGTWGLVTGSETANGFTRSVVISDAERNSSGAIVQSGGTVDSSTKKVVYTVSWNNPIVSSLSSTAYFQRYDGNTAWVQTTQAEFNTGTKTNTTTTSTGGGAVELSSSGGIAFVQSNSLTQDPNAGTISVPFNANVTAGNAIVVAVSWDSAASGNSFKCSDSRNNTYGVAVVTVDTQNVQAMAVCYALNVTAGATTVTATFPSGAAYRSIIVNEYSGIATSDAVDVTASNFGQASTAADAVTSNSATTTMANDLIFGAVCDTDGGAVVSAGSGYTQRGVVNNVSSQDKIQGAVGSVASTNTFSQPFRFASVMVAFRPANTTTVNWTPLSQVSAFDLPSSTTDAVDVAVDEARGLAYLSVGTTVKIFSIINPASPQLLATYTSTGTVNDVTASGNYAYLATTDVELVILNVTNPLSPTVAGSLDLSGGQDGRAVYLVGDTLYMGRAENTVAGQNEFFVINVTNRAAPAALGSLNLTGNTNDLFVSGSYAYLATANTVGEFTTINVANSAAPSLTKLYDAAGVGAGRGVFAIGTTVYFVKDQSSEGPEYYIFNSSNAANPSVTGSYEAGATLQGVYTNGNRSFIVGTITNAQLRTLNISTPSSPTVYSSLNMGVTINDVTPYGNYLVMASTSNTAELVLAKGAISYTPTSGGSGYQSSGTFESSTFDAGSSVAYNNILFTITEPASTNIRFQVATNNDNATWTYVGPDGTAATFYDTSSVLRFNTTGRYIRYKATLTGPGTSTPSISDVSVNYSP